MAGSVICRPAVTLTSSTRYSAPCGIRIQQFHENAVIRCKASACPAGGSSQLVTILYLQVNSYWLHSTTSPGVMPCRFNSLILGEHEPIAKCTSFLWTNHACPEAQHKKDTQVCICEYGMLSAFEQGGLNIP